ncbi:hypothetical protein NQ315_002937 [Exocentrus adspersus]|uniref:Uncharacterized protein n=1 Tax=Exocentrus adspersus TaxID=1586481 RepID=A0AAV8W3U4_9CUCU|nr:hypothetical protein NQ315_002937 [Exocentrus adspersus]
MEPPSVFIINIQTQNNDRCIMKTKASLFCQETASSIKSFFLVFGMNVCFAFIIVCLIIRHNLQDLNVDGKKYKWAIS